MRSKCRDGSTNGSSAAGHPPRRMGASRAREGRAVRYKSASPTAARHAGVQFYRLGNDAPSTGRWLVRGRPIWCRGRLPLQPALRSGDQAPLVRAARLSRVLARRRRGTRSSASCSATAATPSPLRRRRGDVSAESFDGLVSRSRRCGVKLPPSAARSPSIALRPLSCPAVPSSGTFPRCAPSRIASTSRTIFPTRARPHIGPSSP